MLVKQLHKHQPTIPENSLLYSIYQKVNNKERIGEDEALTLFQSHNIVEIGIIADLVNQRFNQNKVYYILNGHINYSNVCAIQCSFCSFSTKYGDHNAYEMSLEDIRNKFSTFNQDEIREIHMVGGLHPDMPFSYYEDMIQTIKTMNPRVTVKAFTAVEIAHFADLFNMSLENVFKRLIDKGLEALPGGGAEIFSEAIRRKICPTKISGDQWLEVHRIAHRSGIKSNATMLFGHIETYEDRIDHLKRLRDLQDQTNGFLTFIPLTYHPEHNPLRSNRTSVLDELKTIAVSRIFLDNFPHIKAYWIMLSIKAAQIALSFGADDLDGTVKEEKIYHAAGAEGPQMLSKSDLIDLITECRKIPVERDSFYNEIQS